MTDPRVDADIKLKRARLQETLDELEERLDVKKRATEVGDKAKESYNDNPVPYYLVAGAVVAVVGGLVAWALFTND
ncbi:DUF3618 domain-containing protein [Desertivibrio insolitus]|uniref:DUF3618 domain-containing protein n=1 Tax=Herbiconiux sp. SYSU D00978 TaxID=2812562 RepID=UPI001A966FB6|nr:DUF3618 domain-containing protein [Herbiconiux sp. SYSU D00978]